MKLPSDARNHVLAAKVLSRCASGGLFRSLDRPHYAVGTQHNAN